MCIAKQLNIALSLKHNLGNQIFVCVDWCYWWWWGEFGSLLISTSWPLWLIDAIDVEVHLAHPLMKGVLSIKPCQKWSPTNSGEELIQHVPGFKNLNWIELNWIKDEFNSIHILFKLHCNVDLHRQCTVTLSLSVGNMLGNTLGI
jgi:hypothetical protein